VAIAIRPGSRRVGRRLASGESDQVATLRRCPPAVINQEEAEPLRLVAETQAGAYIRGHHDRFVPAQRLESLRVMASISFEWLPTSVPS
jgi:hypothetical protein